MLEIFETPATVLHVLTALLLVLIVLIQPGKSGGISAALGGAGAQQVFGGRGAGNFLTKGTWALAATFFFTSVFLAYIASSVGDTLEERAAIAAEAEPTIEPESPTGAAGEDEESDEAPAQEKEPTEEAPGEDEAEPEETEVADDEALGPTQEAAEESEGPAKQAADPAPAAAPAPEAPAPKPAPAPAKPAAPAPAPSPPTAPEAAE